MEVFAAGDQTTSIRPLAIASKFSGSLRMSPFASFGGSLGKKAASRGSLFICWMHWSRLSNPRGRRTRAHSGRGRRRSRRASQVPEGAGCRGAGQRARSKRLERGYRSCVTELLQNAAETASVFRERVCSQKD